MNLLELKNVTKHYLTGSEVVKALEDVTLEVKYGEFVVIMGPSGSGKSTLLSIIGGLNRPTSGTVVVDGIDIYSLSQEKLADFRREYIGFVFQSFYLIPYLTVLENVMLPLIVTDYTKEQKIAKAKEILERVGLSSKMKRFPDELSGGEQQRVAIARALVNEPLLILADEPTGNLDSLTGIEIMKLFKELNDSGKTIIVVTHNPENAKFADRCVYVKDGKLLGIEVLP
ncbi:putative ABC transport system ATP-binding protein [Candidatus Kryptonium thompsonii]|uniref:Putative ABC transport system ATP-binding protein n=1 Tax=Candidatus Kryptonium thompsonii TaxID=1633631 RepID=A0A0P1LQW4_9BACT|nr:ABC transporter ATP-binding protein [Candidatus Kryptonium thompsoni]CUS80084.1 putative ABC transport system ATP-binding protein [Candidatus Kryptonium thompsoni]CUS80720.1 putative ABC transport system ATP-binding protein [Candidatus Kryptonium thompsoni]CUS82254.1 putative ABC transport system ATP-binding protein [Candidatus Kryptonium thompsoni]CUS84414.1 putative ABC transport system ATP-binding protein [Candidatus Kryptonium thompsoni]CUS85265.1 putative ABC transport system ATP-bindi